MTEPRMIKHPTEISDEDMELFLKEWKLAGYEVSGEGNLVLGHDPQDTDNSHFVYQKIDGRWVWVDIYGINRLGARMTKKYEFKSHKVGIEATKLAMQDYLSDPTSKQITISGEKK